MISRVAENCFWFGRYIERAESAARVLSVTSNLALDGELAPEQCWLPVVVISGELERFEARTRAADFSGGLGEGLGEAAQRFLAWDEENPTSIVRTVRAARDNARCVRELVSREVFEATNELHLYVGSAAGTDEYSQNRYAFYKTVRDRCQLTLGLLRSTMLHDEALDFIWLGVLLERVGQTARNLDIHHHALAPVPDPSPVVEAALWLSLLRACSGMEPFMRRHQGRVTGDAVAAFLVTESRFPRSIRYCIESSYDRLCAIRPPGSADLPGGRALGRLGELRDGLPREGVSTRRVHELLTHVVVETAAVCDLITEELFRYGPTQGAAARPSPRMAQSQSAG